MLLLIHNAIIIPQNTNDISYKQANYEKSSVGQHWPRQKWRQRQMPWIIYQHIWLIFARKSCSRIFHDCISMKSSPLTVKLVLCCFWVESLLWHGTSHYFSVLFIFINWGSDQRTKMTSLYYEKSLYALFSQFPQKAVSDIVPPSQMSLLW
jgi:hypothetical protein